jgi:hypothetical protein
LVEDAKRRERDGHDGERDNDHEKSLHHWWIFGSSHGNVYAEAPLARGVSKVLERIAHDEGALGRIGSDDRRVPDDPEGAECER